MVKRITTLTTLLGLIFLATWAAFPLHAETRLRALFMEGSAYGDAEIRAMTGRFTAAHPEMRVTLDFAPYEDLRDLTLGATDSGTGYDVVVFDAIWPAEYADRQILLDVTARITPKMRAGVLPGAWTTVDYAGHSYGLPWLLDSKYLFYNKQILARAGIPAPPATWEALLEQARIIADKGILEHPVVWGWAGTEGIVCDFTTLVAAFGGRFAPDGTTTGNPGAAGEALRYMMESHASGLAHPGSIEFQDEDVRRVFESGQAAFALNWSYMYRLSNNHRDSGVAGSVGIAPAPGAEGHSLSAAVNGSMGLGITARSPNPDAAWDYIAFLTNPAEQNAQAQLSLPVWAASYDDPAVTTGQRALVDAGRIALRDMIPRPATPRYQRLSEALQTAIRDALLGRAPPEEALAAAAAIGN